VRQCTGGGDIRIDRRLQRLQGGETLLFTQLVVENHRQTPVIQITGKIQKMNFQVGFAITWTVGRTPILATPGQACRRSRR
jgi:hypothetical protein